MNLLLVEAAKKLGADKTIMDSYWAYAKLLEYGVAANFLRIYPNNSIFTTKYSKYFL